MAASLRAAAAAATVTRTLRPPAVLPAPGEGLRRLLHTTNQQSAPARGSQIQQKKEKLYAASRPHRHPMTSAKKWTAAALVGVAGAIAVGAIATADDAEDWPHCHGCGECVPKKCNQCGWNLPRPRPRPSASECGQACGAAQNEKETTEVK